MTPKEKALELVNEYLENIEDRTGTFLLSNYSAKQCALIAVNEIIKNEQKYYGNREVTYWEEVKQEINKL
jgi:hypothetical protein